MTRQHDTSSDSDATTDATAMPLEAAAAVLGVGLRTIQRRIKAGELGTVERDGARLVLLPTTSATRPATVDATARQLDATSDATRDNSATVEAALRDALAREREQVNFLRAQVESHARAEAELRAALREALKLQARALPSPDAQEAPAVVPPVPAAGRIVEAARPAAQRTPRRRWRWPWE